MSMNTTLSGSGRVDDIRGHSQDGLRGQTKLVKITEDVKEYAAQQGIEESAAIERGLREKSEEFATAGSEVYKKA
jgi:hypothetical protein